MDINEISQDFDIDSLFQRRQDMFGILFSDIHVKERIIKLSVDIAKAFSNKRKLFLAGNGGSFSDAQHIAAEFVGRFNRERGPLPAIALGTNGALTSAIGNDYSFEEIFARELSCLGTEGDIFIALSTSGMSTNIAKAVKKSKKLGISSVGFTGVKGGHLQEIAPCISIPSNETAIIQEGHIVIGHIICELVDRQLAKKL